MDATCDDDSSDTSAITTPPTECGATLEADLEARPPVTHHAPLQIAKDTHLIRQLLGEGTQSPVNIYVNSLVITGREPIVVDTGMANNRVAWMHDVFSLVDPDDIRWVFLSHDDHDHIGNLLPLLEAAPNATVITSWFALERLSGDIELPVERLRWLNDGDTFDAGGRTMALVRPPLYDSPVTRGLFDPATGVYWSVDTYGTPVPETADDVADIDPRFWDEQFLAFNRMNSPWHEIADPRRFGEQVDRVERLGATTIASAHGPLITGANVAEAHRKMRLAAGGPATPLPTQADLDALVDSLAVA